MSMPLTIASLVLCSHTGKVALGSGAKLTIGGNAVLLQNGVLGQSVAGCLQITSPGPPATKQCMTVASVLPPSLAMKLTAGGQPVVLSTLAGLTDGVPPGSLVAQPGQMKFTAS